MTLYLVKHGDSDYRLHRSDGTEIDTYTSDPRGSGSPKPDFVDSIAQLHNGASILGDSQARRDHADILSGNWNYRNIEKHGSSEVPW